MRNRRYSESGSTEMMHTFAERKAFRVLRHCARICRNRIMLNSCTIVPNRLKTIGWRPALTATFCRNLIILNLLDDRQCQFLNINTAYSKVLKSYLSQLHLIERNFDRYNERLLFKWTIRMIFYEYYMEFWLYDLFVPARIKFAKFCTFTATYIY